MVPTLPAVIRSRPMLPESEFWRPGARHCDVDGSARASMRILIFNPSYPPFPCGVGAYTRGLATALVRAGHDVAVVTCAALTTATDGPPRVLPLLGSWGGGAFLRAWPRLARSHPDLVVSCYPAAFRGSHSALYLIPPLAKALLGRPRTIFIVHEFVRSGALEQRLLGLPLLAADRIVAVTEAERDAIVTRYPSVAARTVVRHNPPTIAVVALDPEADARTRATLAPQERPVIGFIGLLQTAAKGFEELLEALARTDALLVATGSLDPANSYHARLAAQIERLGLDERVRWLGFVSDEEAGRLVRAVDAVVLPYRGGAESGYTSLLAALVNGAAVITTRGPQTPPWVREGETALLVDPEDPAGLASAIGRLLTDDSLAAQVRAGARGLSFGWEEIVEAVTAKGRLPTASASSAGRAIRSRGARRDPASPRRE
jgi:glycosyltransferase involved in cell wall biosynthesis